MSLLNSTPEGYKSGFVALIGRPNVGKSTFVNQIIGENIAITSPVAQTTRNRLRAILTTQKSQLVFVDTPGIHKPHHLLGERLVQSSKKLIGEVDTIVLIFDGSQKPGRGDQFIVNLLKVDKNLPVLVILNKWDLVNKSNCKDRLNEYIDFVDNKDWPVFSCSALTGNGCDVLVESISQSLPLGPYLYPPNLKCDQPEEILLSELIREQILLNTREEVPHSVAVRIDRVDEVSMDKNNSSDLKKTAVLATVVVERKSQKGILIGKGGSMLKKIGKTARLKMQKLINGPVYLELFVKVVPDWRSKPARLSEFGYEGK